MAETEDTTAPDDLVQRARLDAHALGQLYDRYYGCIMRFCTCRLFHREAAEDVTAEVFLSVARNLRTFAGNTDAAFRNWIYTIAANLANDYHRKSARRQKLLTQAVQAGSLPRPDGPADNPNLDWPQLYRAILRLKPKHQDLIILRFFEKLPHIEIAAILRMKPVSVRVAQRRALARLRKILEGHQNE
jgi:RNA polymerase sigma-70 factor, ECF subfamily